MARKASRREEVAVEAALRTCLLNFLEEVVAVEALEVRKRAKISITISRLVWRIYTMARRLAWLFPARSLAAIARALVARREQRRHVLIAMAVVCVSSYVRSALVWCNRCKVRALLAADRHD